MQTRFAAILIALCLLVGIASFSLLMSGVMGVPAGEHAAPPGTASVPPVDSPTAGASGTAGTAADPAAADTGMTPAVTPTVTSTVYVEQDSTALPSVSTPPLPTASLAATVPTSAPSAPAGTGTSTQAPTETGTDRTPHVTDTTEKIAPSVSSPASITIHLRAESEAFSPSSITVPAGAEVTIVFDNRDVDIPHNVIIYADRGAPIFSGAVVKGPGQTTDTFTAPSTSGRYVLGCSIPSPHEMGTFIVE